VYLNPSSLITDPESLILESPIVESRASAKDSRIPGFEDARIRDARIRDAGSGMRDEGLADPVYLNPSSLITDPESLILNP
jgi:hypothetical protein